MAEFKLTPQDTIGFLQSFIDSINQEIDEMMEGHDLKRELDSLRLRIELLSRVENNPFKDRIKLLKEELAKREEEYGRINPKLETLDAERRYYRSLLNEISR